MATLNSTPVVAGSLILTHTNRFRKVLSVSGTATHGFVFILTPPVVNPGELASINPDSTALPCADNVFSQAWMESQGWAVVDTSLAALSSANNAFTKGGRLKTHTGKYRDIIGVVGVAGGRGGVYLLSTPLRSAGAATSTALDHAFTQEWMNSKGWTMASLVVSMAQVAAALGRTVGSFRIVG